MHSVIKICIVTLIIVVAAALAFFTSYMIFVRGNSVEATILDITPPNNTSPIRRAPMYRLKISYLDPKSGMQETAFVEKPAPELDADFTYKVGDKIRVMLH